MFNSTPGLDYNKKKHKPNRNSVIVAVLLVIILLIIGAWYMLTPHNQSVVLDNAQTKIVNLPWSARTQKTNVKVFYPKGWDAELKEDESISEMITISNHDSSAVVTFTFGLNDTNGTQTKLSSSDQRELSAMYKYIANEQAKSLDGSINKRINTTFDFSKDDSLWSYQLIKYQETGEQKYELLVYPLTGQTNMSVTATYSDKDDEKVINAIINSIEIQT